jgi:ABC-type branched-subunit amino acid transport system substrate-binding protein
MKHLIMSIALIFIAAAVFFSCKQEITAPQPTSPEGPDKKETPKSAVDITKTGVTDDTILVGTWGPLTGPASPYGAIPRGIHAYFEMINAEGGIHGRKLKVLIRDDAYQPARTKAAVMELVEKEGVFAFVAGVGTSPCMAVKDYLAEKKIPWIGPASGSSNWARTPNRYRFATYPTFRNEAKILIRYLLDHAKKEKIAFIYQNDDYGKEGLETAKAELEKHGKQLVAAVSVEIADVDLNSHVLKLKQADPDVVILWLVSKHAAITMNTSAKLNFKPLWLASSPLSDASMMYSITKGLWEGVIFSSIMELPDSDHPRIKKYREVYEKYGLKAYPNEEWGTFFLTGIQFAEPFVEALKRIGPDLDREKLIEALETLENWDDGIAASATISPSPRPSGRARSRYSCASAKTVKQ